MRVLYLSCHSILEYSEVKMLSELGHEVFSPGGAYQNGHGDGKRPSLMDSVSHNLQLSDVAIQCSKENLHPELISWANVIIVMHKPEWIISNWPKIKHKRVVWRTIGQSVSHQEDSLGLARSQGLQIVRYSPREDRIPGFLGKDSLVRFSILPSEWGPWTGEDRSVITVAQSMKAREKFCGYDIFNKATEGFSRYLYGPGNEDSGIAGGYLSYEDLKEAYKKHRVYFYTGTYPASYTLNFIEAFMSGIPIVAIGPELWNVGAFPNHDLYEVHQILGEGENGFWADDIPTLRRKVDLLLHDDTEAQRISKNARKRAEELFGWEVVKKQWEAFL